MWGRGSPHSLPAGQSAAQPGLRQPLQKWLLLMRQTLQQPQPAHTYAQRLPRVAQADNNSVWQAGHSSQGSSHLVLPSCKHLACSMDRLALRGRHAHDYVYAGDEVPDVAWLTAKGAAVVVPGVVGCPPAADAPHPIRPAAGSQTLA